MAIVKFTAPFEGIRGTTRSTTWTAGKTGPYFHRWRMPAVRTSPGQSASRAGIAVWPPLWRDLDPAQRTAWDAYAADSPQEKFNSLGQSYFASGFNWFTAINRQLLTVGLPMREDPPAIAVSSKPQLTSLTVYDSGTSPPDSELLFPANEFYGHYAILFASLTQGPGSTVCTSHFLLLYAALQTTSTTIDLTPALDLLFGTYQGPQRCFMRAHRQNLHGARSSATLINDDITPAP